MPYHSVVNIKILEVLRGPQQTKDALQLFREDGPITDGRSGAVSIRVAGSANFTVGETSVFFLNNIYTDPYLTAYYKSFFTKELSGFPDPTYWVSKDRFKHDITDSIVHYLSHSIPLSTFRSDIKKVSEIVDAEE